MNEYASRFFLLLKNAISLHAQTQLEWIQIFSVPYMKQHVAKSVINEYKKIIQDKEPVDYARIKEDREALLRKLKGKIL